MALIYTFCKNNNLIQQAPPGPKPFDWSTVNSPLGSLAFLNGGSFNWTAALIDSGKTAVALTLMGLSPDEVNAVCSKLDMIFRNKEQEDIAIMIAEEILNILATIEAVKWQTQSSFGGILAQGTQLDIWPMRPKDVGGVLLNPLKTASLGLYGGTSAGVFDWLTTGLTGGTKPTNGYIPSQTMWQYAGMIHLGAIEKIQVPKIEGIQFTLGGTASPPQPCSRNYKKTWGVGREVSFTRFEKPIIIPPLKTQLVDVMPDGPATATNDTDFEMISLIVAQSQNKSL
jgi:hypothetical protein